MRHCIVTPDALGPVKGGGIGTHCYFLACLLARLGHDVTVLLTITVLEKEKKHWVDYYVERGVRLWYLQDFVDISYPTPLGPDLKTSLKTWMVLQNESFDQLHFQEWRAHGFYCLQARRVMGAFSKTLMTVTTHSSTEWINQGMACWNAQHSEGAKLMWAERYCVEHCDRLISPSYYMLSWLQEAGWTLPQDRRVIPNPIDCPAGFEPYAADVSSIAFFGRLETRKGLELFCEAINQLSEASKNGIRELLFVGVPGMCGRTPGVRYIEGHLPEFYGKVKIHTDLGSFEALKLLREKRSLILLPSLMDNFPYTTVECAVQGLPVLAARTGGIPEILSDEQLFEPTVSGLVEALDRVLAKGHFQASPSLYTMSKVEDAWRAQTQECVQSAERDAHAVLLGTVPPLVSICVAHFNHGKYLSKALDSLAAQDYTNFEVLIADDGSTEVGSILAFASCRASMDKRFRFFEKQNEGPSLTRNFCAQHAQGDYIVFFDSDNVALPHMLSTMVDSMQWSGVDVLACQFWTFGQHEEPFGKPLNRYTPLGADLATGLLENVFGDVNFIVRKDVFEKLGGFAATRHGCEDWEFLAHLSLDGYILDVIPEPLFWYRYTSDGMRSTMSLYHSHQLVFSTYKKYLPNFAASAFDNLLLPMAVGHSVSNAVIIRTMLSLGIALEERYTKLLPAGSLGQRILSALWYKISVFFDKKRVR